MRKYLSDKTLMVYAARTSFEYDDSQFELKTYLEPLVEKRISYGIFKKLNVHIREVNTRIEHPNYQVFNSASEQLVYTETSVVSEDAESREYMDM